MEFVFLIAVLGLISSIVLVPIASTLARRVGLVDRPSIRKRHVGAVPLAGGMVLLTALLLISPFLPKSPAVWAVISLSIPLFVLGALDDRFELSARLRILCQLGIGFCLIVAFDLKISHLDGIAGNYSHTLGAYTAATFTLICTSGVLNATNMSDGIDGLLGFLASLSLAGIGVMAFQANSIPEAVLAFFVLGLLAGYLLFNLRVFGFDRRVFLGDSGSMIVGLVLLTLLISLSQNDTPAFTPTSAGWLLGLPLLDTVSVMVRRIVQGRSPFAAGRDHFHHILQDLGLTRKNTLIALVICQMVFVGIGMVANHVSIGQSYFFWGFVSITVLQYVGISCSIRILGKGKLTEYGVTMNGPESPSVDIEKTFPEYSVSKRPGLSHSSDTEHGKDVVHNEVAALDKTRL